MFEIVLGRVSEWVQNLESVTHTHTHTHTPETPRRKIAHSKDEKVGLKSQSAMEYLMTYGWAILIIAIVLVAFFSLNLFNPYTFSPKASPGSCQILRPNGPGSNLFVSEVGLCNTNEIPQYVGSFSHSSGSRVLLPFIPLDKRSFTVATWIKMPSVADSNSYDLSVFGEGNPAIGCSTNLCMVLLAPNQGGVGLYFGFYNDDIGSPERLVSNVWYFAVWDYNITNNYKYIYLYGGGHSGLDNSGTSGTSFQATGGLSCIGNEETCSVNSFNGSIANVQIYNTSLSQPEITALYQEGIGGAPTNIQNLVGWWPLNGNANDYSGNNNNGNAIGVTYVSSWENGYTAP